MITTKAVKVSLLPEAVPEEAFAEASRFRDELYACLTMRGDEPFELADAVLCAPGAVHSAVELTLVPEHRRGHGAMYDALNQGRIEADWLRQVLVGLPLPRFPDGRGSGECADCCPRGPGCDALLDERLLGEAISDPVVADLQPRLQLRLGEQWTGNGTLPPTVAHSTSPTCTGNRSRPKRIRRAMPCSAVSGGAVAANRRMASTAAGPSRRSASFREKGSAATVLLRSA